MLWTVFIFRNVDIYILSCESQKFQIYVSSISVYISRSMIHHNKYINIYEYVSIMFYSIYLMLGMITIYTEMTESELRQT